MYENRTEPTLDAPVPGMGMTHELGGRPWQTPAQYTTIDDVARYYIAQMQGDSFAEQTANLLETKMPITMIANAMNTNNVMNGVHTIDIGVLSLPIIMEMIMLIGDSAGIDYVTGIERDLNAELQESSMAVAISKIEDASIKPLDEEAIEEPVMEEEEVKQEEPTAMSQGLMARRV